MTVTLLIVIAAFSIKFSDVKVMLERHKKYKKINADLIQRIYLANIYVDLQIFT